MADVMLGNRSREGITVALWDHEFRARVVTRSLQRELRDLGKRLIEAEREGDDDKVVAAMGAMLDARLEINDGKRTKPSKLIGDRWQADELPLAELYTFADEIGEAELARPT